MSAGGALTPEPITNRPALGQVAYRAGRYASFLESMVAALSGSGSGALAGLRTRDPADFSIALIDSWAVVLDILTFYSERLANEAFLRTAAEQRSVVELAALVGYVPSPGVSASAVLAFTLSSAPGSPGSVVIPAGTRVQSVPGPGQTAQVFETSADLTALAAWNALPARTTVPWTVTAMDWYTSIAGTSNNVSAGDALLFSGPAGGPAVEFHYVTAVTPDHAAKTTQVAWETALVMDGFGPGTSMYVFRKKAALYGANAPNPQTFPSAAGSLTYFTHVPGFPQSAVPRAHWDYIYDDGTEVVHLDAVYPGLVPQAGGPPQWLVLTRVQGAHTYTLVTQITAAWDTTPDYYTLTSKVTTVKLTLVQYLVDGAADPSSPAKTLNQLLHEFVKDTPRVTVYMQSAQLTGAPLPIFRPIWDSYVTVIGGQQIAPNQPAALSGKRLRLPVPPGTGATFAPAGPGGGPASADGQVFLIDWSSPDIFPGASYPVITISGVAGTLTIPPNPSLNLALPTQPADPSDPVTGETIVVQGVTPLEADVTRLTLTAPLSRAYDTPTVRVNANAVLATHGETVQEILGSGDAANPALAFTLKQVPLTYLTAPVPSGAQSTLQVWVNNLRWQQTPNLLAAGAADRVFVTSTDAMGHTVVRFGDGTRGGRPPTGPVNIRAVYRKGTGLAGMVDAGQLSQPLDRPQGLSAVTNLSPATGAADPATADEVRTSAPLPTMTISRVVSLQDYQDYALGFAGIAKALATWTWSGGVRGVCLTVAGANGTALAPGDPVITSLTTSLRQYGDPHVPLLVVSYVRVLFTFTAGVAVDTTSYNPSLVFAQAWQQVRAYFAFARRALGQAVATSEIVQVIQGVPGVTAVRLTGLARSGQQAGGGSVLLASGPSPTATPPAGAELLLLDPATQGQIGAWS
jgi:hypothetical protein